MTERERGMSERIFKLSRTFVVWGKPGGAELGRVELVRPGVTRGDDQFSGCTVEEITIPQGCVLRYVVEDVGEFYE